MGVGITATGSLGSKYKYLSIYLFFSTTFISQEMGALRFAIATSALLVALKSWEQKQKLHAVSVLFVGSLFHTVSFFGFLALVMASLTPRRHTYILMLVLSTLFFFLSAPIVQFLVGVISEISAGYGNKITNYVSSEGRAVLQFGILYRFLIFLLFLVFMNERTLNSNINIKVFFLSIVMAGVFGSVNFLAQRLSIYFAVVEPVLIAEFVSRVRNPWKGLLIAFFCTLYGLRLVRYLLVYSDSGNPWLPYTSIFGSSYFF